MTRAVEVSVAGEVQGVSFRAYAAKEAVRLEVVGWVRNASDGSVEAHIEGPDDAVEEMLDWLHGGSPQAEVSEVTVHDVEPSGADSFQVDY